jgi:hypothetical protein
LPKRGYIPPFGKGRLGGILKEYSRNHLLFVKGEPRYRKIIFFTTSALCTCKN